MQTTRPGVPSCSQTVPNQGPASTGTQEKSGGFVPEAESLSGAVFVVRFHSQPVKVNIQPAKNRPEPKLRQM